MRFLNNFKKPQGALGDKIIDQMNDKNAQISIWGISHLNIGKNSIILDIGCGGGANIKRMSEKALKVYGVDYSAKSVERSREYNLDQSNVTILEASVSNLPFKDNTFDIITAFKTVFFWPDLLNDFKEVKRVLKNDGVFAVIVDYNGSENKIMNFAEKLLEMDSKSDVETTDLLLEAGFSEVTSYIRQIKYGKEIIKVDNIKRDEITDTFTANASPSDMMNEWVCILAEK